MSEQPSGFAARRFAAVRDAFAANFERHGDLGAACCVYRHGEPVVDLWAGFADRRRRAPLGGGHGGHRLLRHQGRHRHLRAPAGRARRARPRRADRRLLAGVRGGGKGGDPAALGALPPRRAGGGRRRADPRRGAGLGAGGARDRRPGAELGAGDGARLPRQVLRLDPRRGGAAGLRPHAGALVRRGDRGAARPRGRGSAARRSWRRGGRASSRRPPGCRRSPTCSAPTRSRRG